MGGAKRKSLSRSRSCCPRPWFLPLLAGVPQEWFLAQGHHHNPLHVPVTWREEAWGWSEQSRHPGKASGYTTYGPACLGGLRMGGGCASRFLARKHPTWRRKIESPDGPGTTVLPRWRIRSDDRWGASGRTAIPWWLRAAGGIKRPAACTGRVYFIPTRGDLSYKYNRADNK